MEAMTPAFYQHLGLHAIPSRTRPHVKAFSEVYPERKLCGGSIATLRLLRRLHVSQPERSFSICRHQNGKALLWQHRGACLLHPGLG